LPSYTIISALNMDDQTGSKSSTNNGYQPPEEDSKSTPINQADNVTQTGFQPISSSKNNASDCSFQPVPSGAFSQGGFRPQLEPETFAHAYAQGFSQGFSQGFAKGASYVEFPKRVQGGFSQGGFQPVQGGLSQGGFSQGGFSQGGFSQGGFSQGGFQPQS
jgi:hypothetical protein